MAQATKMVRTFAILSFFLLFSPAVHSEIWQEYYGRFKSGGYSGPYERYHLDLDSITRLGKQSSLMDVRIKNTVTNNIDLKTKDVAIIHALVDCDLRLLRNYRYDYFDDTGNISHSDTIATRDNLIEEFRSSFIERENQRSFSELELAICKTIWKAKEENKIQIAKEDEGVSAAQSRDNIGMSSIPLRLRSGVYEVKATINGEISVHFIVDSGASQVSIPESLARILVDNGSMSKSDIIGTQMLSFANGATGKGTVVNIRSLEIGGHKILNVRAVVMSEKGAPLLLGQSALKKLGSWSINSRLKVLEVGQRNSSTE